MLYRIQRILALITTIFVLAMVGLQPSQAVEIREVTSKTGVKAWLVEDYTLPIISMSFAFKGGSLQDPQGKGGLTRLTTALFDEGAGPYDASSFRSKLEELGISLGFSAGRETISGSVRTVSDERDTAFEMLRLALHETRFEDEAIERMRDAIRLGIIRSKTNPGAVSALALRESLFGEHPYALPASGDEATIDAITRDDILAAKERLFARDNLYVGVVGAISEAQLVDALDKVFGSLPEKAVLAEIPEIAPNLGLAKTVSMPVPNASINLIFKGLKRDDPDFFAAHLMNHVLGGSSFTSKLYKEVREKRGLAYSVSSGLAAFDRTAYLAVGTSTRADNQTEAISVIRNTVARLVEEGITAEELDAAKRYVAGSYAINNLDTSSSIANVLVSLQTENLGIDYINDRREQIAAVTLEDVNRLAKELLSVEPTIVVVVPQEE